MHSTQPSISSEINELLWPILWFCKIISFYDYSDPAHIYCISKNIFFSEMITSVIWKKYSKMYLQSNASHGLTYTNISAKIRDICSELSFEFIGIISGWHALLTVMIKLSSTIWVIIERLCLHPVAVFYSFTFVRYSWRKVQLTLGKKQVQKEVSNEL